MTPKPTAGWVAAILQSIFHWRWGPTPQRVLTMMLGLRSVYLRPRMAAGAATAVAALVTVLACSAGQESSPRQASESADVRVRKLADQYLEGFFDRNPDQVTFYGVPGRHHDRLPDNSLAAQKAWEAKEDAWLVEARAITAASIESPSLKATHAIIREALESSINGRVCRSELWNVSQMTGWQIGLSYLVTIQP